MDVFEQLIRNNDNRMADITQLLYAASQGDKQAAAELLPVVYAELRRLASARMAQQGPGQTLQATELVHEAYLKLVGGHDDPRWRGREHFFAAAAEAMRHILVDRARRRNAEKRGGGAARVELHEDIVFAQPTSDDLVIAVDSVLEKLASVDADAAKLVKLRYYVGLTIPETADIMGISTSSADRLWAYARSWLKMEITEG